MTSHAIVLRRAAPALRGMTSKCAIPIRMKISDVWSHPWERLAPTTVHRRQLSGLSSITSWVRDVVRNRSLQPPNPILESLKQIADNKSAPNPKQLPQFSRMLPYHLDGITQDVQRQYHVDLAELEVKITDGNDSSNSSFSVLDELDRIEAPLAQIYEVGRLFSQLAAHPDEMVQWQQSHAKSKSVLMELPQRESKIIYKALLAEKSKVPPSILKDFQKNGAHAEDDQTRDQLRELNYQLRILSDRLSQVHDFMDSPKKVRLQAVSDVYNIVGLSHRQAELLGFPDVSALVMDVHMASAKQVQDMYQEVTSLVKPRIRNTVKLDEAVLEGAFLPSKAKGPSSEGKELWEAARSVKKLLFLDGVMKGLCDLCDGLLGVGRRLIIGDLL